MPELKEDRACSFMWKAETRTGRLSTGLQVINKQFKVVFGVAAAMLVAFTVDISFSSSSILTTVDCQSVARHAQNIRRGAVTETSANLLGEH